MADLAFTWRGEALVALPERLLFWPRTRTLFAADVDFRADADASERLERSLARTNARRLIILGALVCADDPAVHLTGRLKTTRLSWVTGAMSEAALAAAARLGAACVVGPTPGPLWALSAAPYEPSIGYALVGGVRPVVTLADGESAPCFCFGPRCAVLPAFSATFAAATIHPQPGDWAAAIRNARVEIVTTGLSGR